MINTYHPIIVLANLLRFHANQERHLGRRFLSNDMASWRRYGHQMMDAADQIDEASVLILEQTWGQPLLDHIRTIDREYRGRFIECAPYALWKYAGIVPESN